MTFSEHSTGDHYINAASLLIEFEHFIESHPLLDQLNQRQQCWPLIVDLCQDLEQYSEVMRALTVLHTRSQIDFERGLFCAWSCMMVARHCNLNLKHQRALFYAGLLQDLGRHAVDADVSGFISRVNGPFIAQSSKQLQADSHPLVSSIFLESHMQREERVSELVLHHHAREDGTGFPQHVGEAQLDLDDQILIIANETSDRLDKLGGHNQLLDCVAHIKLGSALYFNRAHAAWLGMLSPVLDSSSTGLNAHQCQQLSNKRDSLEKVLSSLLAVSGELLRYDFDLHVHGLRSSIQKLARLFAETGILNKNLFQHTCERGMQGETDSCRALGDVADMFIALPQTLERCTVHMEYLLPRGEFDINRTVLSEALSRIHQCCDMLNPRRTSIFR